MNWLNRIKYFFEGKRVVKEYVYFFSLQTGETFKEKPLDIPLSELRNEYKKHVAQTYNSTSMQTRMEVVSFIKNDVAKHGKDIRHSDVLVDSQEYRTYFTFATQEISNLYLRPAFFQLYAYKKKKSTDVFTYPHKTLLFKKSNTEVKVIKLEIECLIKRQ